MNKCKILRNKGLFGEFGLFCESVRYAEKERRVRLRRKVKVGYIEGYKFSEVDYNCFYGQVS